VAGQATEQKPPPGTSEFRAIREQLGDRRPLLQFLAQAALAEGGTLTGPGSGDHGIVGYSSRGERRSRATGHEVSDVGQGNHQSNRGSDLKLRQRLHNGSRLAITRIISYKKVGGSIEILPYLGVVRTGATARADGRQLNRSRMRTRSSDGASSRTGYWHELRTMASLGTSAMA
jgi:hypothetical protein